MDRLSKPLKGSQPQLLKVKETLPLTAANSDSGSTCEPRVLSEGSSGEGLLSRVDLKILMLKSTSASARILGVTSKKRLGAQKVFR